MCLPVASVLPIANNENFRHVLVLWAAFRQAERNTSGGNVPRSGTTRQRCETTILHPIFGTSLPRFVAVHMFESGPRLPTRYAPVQGSFRTNTGKVILALSI